LAAARAGRYDLPLVYRRDRFSRRIRDLATLMDELDHAGVAFRSATGSFDTCTAAGRLFVQMLGAFAEFEREVIIDRVIAGMERKAASGARTHGPRPYGYLVHPDTHRPIPHPDEQHVVRDIFTRYAGTRSVPAPSPHSSTSTASAPAPANPGPDTPSAGCWPTGSTSAKSASATSPPRAPTRRWSAGSCSSSVSGSSPCAGQAHSRRAAATSDYQLTGLITCPQCGCTYVGTSATGKLRRYRYYTCFSHTRYGSAGCTAARIDADQLDAVRRALVDFYTRTDLITAAIAAETALRADGADRHAADAVTTQIAKTEAAIDRYLTAFDNATLDERTCGHRVRDLAATRDHLTARREEPRDLAAPRPAQPLMRPSSCAATSPASLTTARRGNAKRSSKPPSPKSGSKTVSS
jgi:site-specific DNA recombinase